MKWIIKSNLVDSNPLICKPPLFIHREWEERQEWIELESEEVCWSNHLSDKHLL